MKKTIVLLFALAASAMFAQERKETEKHGMFWFWFDGAKKCNVEWDQAAKTRTDAFKSLDEKVKDGDPAKVRLYMGRARDAQSKVDSAWACGYDYSRNLAEHAAVALNASDAFSSSGKITEAEYDEATTLVKTLKAKIKDQPLPEAQKSIWMAALQAANIPPTDILYTGIFHRFATCDDGKEPVDGNCTDGSKAAK